MGTNMKTKHFVCLLLTLVCLATPALAQAAINFAWDPHPEATNLTGFKLYQTTISGNYSQPAVATFTGGALTTGSIPNPTRFGRYYFILRAFFNDTTTTPVTVIESDNSNEVSSVLKPKPPRLASVVQSVVMAPVKGAVYIARVFVPQKGLRTLP